MAFTDVIDDYTQGATGYLLDINGDTIGYTVTDGGDNRDTAYHGDNSTFLYADGSDKITVTFDQQVVGATIALYGGDSDEFYRVMVDGQVVDLNQMIADGEATFENIGTSSTYQLNADGTISGGIYTDGSVAQITFLIPVTSIGAVGASPQGAIGSDGLEIGVDYSMFAAVCFARGTELMTQTGPKLIENLTIGDMLYTKDNGFKPILWIGQRRINTHLLAASEKLRPVRIQARALGRGLPEQDLWVSRQHRVLISSKIAQDICGVSEVLIPAIKLVGLPGIDVDVSLAEVEYFHVLLDAHEVIYAHGAPSESLHMGPEGLRSMSAEAREEIFTIFPDCRDGALEQAHIYPVPEPAKQKRLIARHASNQKTLLELHGQ